MLAFVLWYGLLLLSIIGDVFLYIYGFHITSIIVGSVIGTLVGIYIGVTLLFRALCGTGNTTFWMR